MYTSWKEDPAADSYSLMRSQDVVPLDFKEIYAGKDTSFSDTDLIPGGRYVYRLDKYRGYEVFKGDECSYGFCSNLRNDEQEPNDSENSPVQLDSDLKGNLACVRYTTKATPQEWVDEDWFYISLPAQRTAEILISQENLQNQSNGINTQIYFQVLGEQVQLVWQNTALKISNSSLKRQDILFRIFPDTTTLFSSSTHIASIEYRISLNQIYKY